MRAGKSYNKGSSIELPQTRAAYAEKQQILRDSLEPVLAYQTHGSRRKALACSCCAAFLGDWRSQLQFATDGTHKTTGVSGLIAPDSFALTLNFPTVTDTDTVSSSEGHVGLLCSAQCGATYCSLSCYWSDQRKGHWLVCRGRSRRCSDFDPSHSSSSEESSSCDGEKCGMEEVYSLVATEGCAEHLIAMELVALIVASAAVSCAETGEWSAMQQLLSESVSLFLYQSGVNELNCADVVDDGCCAEDDVSIEIYNLFVTVLLLKKRILGRRLQDFSDSILSNVSIALWHKLLWVARRRLMPVILPSPALTFAMGAVSLSTADERRAVLRCSSGRPGSASYYDYAVRSRSFLEGNQWLAHRNNQSQHSERAIEEERLVARLSQAASVATHSHLDNSFHSEEQEDANPFEGLAYVALVLIPFHSNRLKHRVLHSNSHSVTNIDELCLASIESTGLLTGGCCLANTYLAADTTSSSSKGRGLKIELKANRDIIEGELLTYHFTNNSELATRRKKRKRNSHSLIDRNVAEFDVGTDSGTMCMLCRSKQIEVSGVLRSVFPKFSQVLLASSLHSRRASCPSVATIETVRETLSNRIVTECSTNFLCLLLMSLLDLVVIPDSVRHDVDETDIEKVVELKSLADYFLNQSHVEGVENIKRTLLSNGVAIYSTIVMQYILIRDCTNSYYADAKADVTIAVEDSRLSFSSTVSTNRRKLFYKKLVEEVIDSLATLMLDLLVLSDCYKESLAGIGWWISKTLWLTGNQCLSNHRRLSQQAKKIKYHESASVLNHDVINFKTEELIPGAAFLTIDRIAVVSCAECDCIISMAEYFAGNANDRLSEMQLLEKKLLLLSSKELPKQTTTITCDSHASGSTGWSTARHYAFPTTDIAIHEIAGLKLWFGYFMAERVTPLINSQFLSCYDQCSSHRVEVVDAFIVKYNCSDCDITKQRHLPIHSDQSTHSLTVALNSSDKFSGGGTYFTELGRSVNPGKRLENHPIVIYF